MGYWQVSFSLSDPRWKCSKPVGLVPLSWSAEGERDSANDSRNGLQVLGKRSLLTGFLHFMLQLLLQFWIKIRLQWSLSKTLFQRMVLLSFFNLRESQEEIISLWWFQFMHSFFFFFFNLSIIVDHCKRTKLLFFLLREANISENCCYLQTS